MPPAQLRGADRSIESSVDRVCAQADFRADRFDTYVGRLRRLAGMRYPVIDRHRVRREAMTPRVWLPVRTGTQAAGGARARLGDDDGHPAPAGDAVRLQPAVHRFWQLPTIMAITDHLVGLMTAPEDDPDLRTVSR